MLQEKILRIQAQLKRDHQDYLMIGNFGHQIHDDILYWIMLEQLEYGYLIIPASGKPILYAISFEVDQLQHKRSDIIDILPTDKPVQSICESLGKETSCVLAIHSSALPTATYQKLAIIPSLTLQEFTESEHLVIKKEPKEISRMRQAAKLTDIIFSELLKCWPDFYTEADVANCLLQLMAERGVEPSFPPIVASGKNAANPHHHPDYKQINTGFCVIDFGVRFKGYCSDMTRTIYVGTPTETEQNVYQQLLSAQEKTIQKLAPGISVHELDDYCRAELGEELAHYFIHSLGHGLGTQVHEVPSVSKRSAMSLEENMIITIEPGVYLPNEYGIRIEDDILITEQGYDVLTLSSKKLLSTTSLAK